MRDPEIAAAAKLAIAFGSDGGYQNVGRINRYTCQGKTRGGLGRLIGTAPPCGTVMITIDREPGVTPFMTKCPSCGGDTQSGFYRVPQTLIPTHEWYRPDSFDGLTAQTIEHIRKGGLILRKIEVLDAIEYDKKIRELIAKVEATVDGEETSSVLCALEGALARLLDREAGEKPHPQYITWAGQLIARHIMALMQDREALRRG